MTERRKPTKPTYRDHNGNTRSKWRRKSGVDFGKSYTEYSMKYGKTELSIWTWSDWKSGPDKREKPYHYRVNRNGEPIGDGWADSATGAKIKAEEIADGYHD